MSDLDKALAVELGVALPNLEMLTAADFESRI